METEKEIWVSLPLIRKILGLDRTTIYRRVKNEKLEQRKNSITDRKEIKLPEGYKDKYLELIKE
jgi:hypothetical protein